MNRSILISLLLGLFLPSIAFCAQEDRRRKGGPQQNMERKMQMWRMEMELESREAEMGFDRRVRELELEDREMELQQRRQKMSHYQKGRKKNHGEKLCPLFILGAVVVHILVAIWVYQDLRRRGRGSGIWIVVALLAGLLGTLVYAVVRLGDKELKTES